MTFQEAKRRLLIMCDLKLDRRSEKGLGLPVQIIRVFSEYIEMEFGIEKCAMLVIEKGKILKSVRELPDSKVIKPVQVGKTYKYPRVLEAYGFLGEEMKLKASREYFRRFSKVS